MLYPILTESRLVLDLCGVWDFRLLSDAEAESLDPGKKIADAIPMAVPSAYNDLYEGRAFREHMGKMVYQRAFGIAAPLLEKHLTLRFDSAAHSADIFLNGNPVGSHKGGFLPFSLNINNSAKQGENLLTVIISNLLDHTTLPCGRIVAEEYPGMEPVRRNLPNFDFFNYSGLLRPVRLCAAPRAHIEDVVVSGGMDRQFTYKVATTGEGVVSVLLRGPDGEPVWRGNGACGGDTLSSARLWSPEDPALYTLEVSFLSNGERDVYKEQFGFRTVGIEDCRLTLNGKPVYLKGFGKHEDTPVNGRGLNEAYNIKDLALMKWMGANSFRTSHYPYSEEMLRLCDREGILVIGEVPAVGLHTGFTAVGLLGGKPDGTWTTLQTAPHHRDVLRDMLARDKNHPCIVAWSVANEPASEEEGAREYFAPLVALTKELDPQNRPVTIVTYEGSSPEACKVAELCDLLILNRYRGWYDTEGNLPAAAARLRDELEQFHARCPEKPIMLGEYGADAVAGLHSATADLFSEEYQAEYLAAYSEVFDSLPYITGEHVWNFADFATAENIKRVQGNKKGVFTRDRRPKLAAHYLRERWTKPVAGKE